MGDSASDHIFTCYFQASKLILFFKKTDREKMKKINKIEMIVRLVL